MHRAAAFVVVTVLTAAAGCEDSNNVQSDPLTYDEAVQAGFDTPVEQSVNAVVRSIAKSTVFIATEDAQTRWKMGVDNNGDSWAYFYTSESELSAALPAGSRFVEMQFADAFGIVDADTSFRGIYINSASEWFYTLPRELFADARRILENAATK